MKHSNKEGIKYWSVTVLKALALAFPLFLMLTVIWFSSVWSTMTVNELLYHLFSPLEGTGESVLSSFFVHSALPGIGIWIAMIFAVHFLSGKKAVNVIVCVLAVCIFIGDIAYFLWKIDFYNYVVTLKNGSSFIEENYVDPAEVEITFPEKKRNLIYIYMESMEVTYADKKSGGAFDYNIIPELTDLASEGENFSGNTGYLNGGYSLPGTDWTVAGIIAQTSGLPLQVQVGKRSTSFDAGYYQSVVTLGDILKDNGYRQYFMCGSNASFAGKADYLTAHGNYELDDFPYAVSRGWLEDTDYSDWGYNDQKLFAFAKERLTEISRSDEPFNFSMLTIDTHFGGSVCELCRDDFDSLTENVYACSNRQIVDFVHWIQQQSFYENTTVVLCGDHTTMDASFSDTIDDDYNRRTYSLFINAPIDAQKDDSERIYTTLDMFPTTLTSLGATFEGGRLGLGTDLFSGMETLSETFGIEAEKKEIETYSPFLAQLSGIDPESITEQEKAYPKADADIEIDEDKQVISVSVSNLKDKTRKLLYGIYLQYYSDGDGGNKKNIRMKKKQGKYYAEIPISDVNIKYLDLNIYYRELFGEEYQVYGQDGDARLKIDDLSEYADCLKDYIASPDYAVMIAAVNHNAMNCLDEEQISRLRELGLKVDMNAGDYKSYAALIEDGTINEQIGDDEVELQGSLEDGTDYHLKSNWRDERSSHAYLEVNGINYRIDTSGLQFLVYDKANGIVADKVCFNFNLSKAVRRMEYLQ